MIMDVVVVHRGHMQITRVAETTKVNVEDVPNLHMENNETTT